MTKEERKIWNALVRHAKYRLSIDSIDLIVIEDDIQSLIAMDSHVRELEAENNRLEDENQKLMNGVWCANRRFHEARVKGELRRRALEGADDDKPKDPVS